MSFYIYRPVQQVFLAEDETTWTDSLLSAAGFTSRAMADDIAIRQLGEGHDACVLDDGVDD
ncbi:hypothetical protein [Acidovorax sp.]|uniref:hypothetical protein n=1 Tax=Acidovorax sp. TaxID=1872122 RepID=UPI00391FBD1F